MNIYQEVIEAQGVLSLVDNKNELLGLIDVRMNFVMPCVWRDGIFYKPEFMDRYCSGGLVRDEDLREYIGEVEMEVERICLGKRRRGFAGRENFGRKDES